MSSDNTTKNCELMSLPHIDTGTYRHYKGALYEVKGVCLDSETLEAGVVYSPLYDSKIKYWVRPYEIFTGFVEVEGLRVSRFLKVK